jgi:hypothetical protein
VAAVKENLLFLPKQKRLKSYNIGLVHEIVTDTELGARMAYATFAR